MKSKNSRTVCATTSGAQQVYAVGKYSISSEPFYKRVNTVSTTKKTRSKLLNFLLRDISISSN